MAQTRKYLDYLVQVSEIIESSDLPEKYRLEAFKLASTPMHYWTESEEGRSAGDVVSKYDSYIGFAGDEIATQGYLGDMFPKIARELEAIGYRYSKERRCFVPLVKERHDTGDKI